MTFNNFLYFVAKNNPTAYFQFFPQIIQFMMCLMFFDRRNEFILNFFPKRKDKNKKFINAKITAKLYNVVKHSTKKFFFKKQPLQFVLRVE